MLNIVDCELPVQDSLKLFNFQLFSLFHFKLVNVNCPGMLLYLPIINVSEFSPDPKKIL